MCIHEIIPVFSKMYFRFASKKDLPDVVGIRVDEAFTFKAVVDFWSNNFNPLGRILVSVPMDGNPHFRVWVVVIKDF